MHYLILMMLIVAGLLGVVLVLIGVVEWLIDEGHLTVDGGFLQKLVVTNTKISIDISD